MALCHIWPIFCHQVSSQRSGQRRTDSKQIFGSGGEGWGQSTVSRIRCKIILLGAWLILSTVVQRGKGLLQSGKVVTGYWIWCSHTFSFVCFSSFNNTQNPGEYIPWFSLFHRCAMGEGSLPFWSVEWRWALNLMFLHTKALIFLQKYPDPRECTFSVQSCILV